MVKRQRGGDNRLPSEQEGTEGYTGDTDCSSNASASNDSDEDELNAMGNTNAHLSKRAKLLPTIAASTPQHHLDDLLAVDDLSAAIDVVHEIRRMKDEDLASWVNVSTEGVCALVTKILDANHFPIQLCMFTSLCHVLCVLSRLRHRLEIDQVYDVLPPTLLDVMPMESCVQDVSPINIRRRLNMLNRSLGNIFSFRTTKCWIQERHSIPQRVKTEGWVDLGGDALSFCRDDEALGVVCVPIHDICDIRFNSEQCFGRVYFQHNAVNSIGFMLQRSHFGPFRKKIQDCFRAAIRDINADEPCVASPIGSVTPRKTADLDDDNKEQASPGLVENFADHGIDASDQVDEPPSSIQIDANEASPDGQPTVELPCTRETLPLLFDDLRLRVDHINILRKKVESRYEELEDSVRVKSSKLTDLISHTGMKQVERGEALGDLEHQLKCLAHDLHVTEKTMLPQLHEALHNQAADMERMIASAKDPALANLRALSLCTVNAAKSKRWASPSAIATAAAIAFPCILFGAVSMSSLGYA